MRKVIVLGCPGSGKTIFSGKLEEYTRLPLFHLDNMWWKPDKTHVSRSEFDEMLASVSLSSKVCKFFDFLWWPINRPPFLRDSIKRKFFIYGF